MPAASRYDVGVIGLGGMGSSVAYHLARRGARVLGLEQFGPAHDRGSSHGESRIIRLAYFEGAAYVPLLLRAYELWEQLQRESGQHLLTITGGLYVGAPGSSRIDGARSSVAAHNLAHEILTSDQIRRRFPPFRPPKHFAGVYEPQAGVIDPEGSVRAALALAGQQGADLHFGERVLRLELGTGGEGATIATERATYTCERVVLACGPWTDQILPDLHLPLSVVRMVMHWFKPIDRPEQFLPDRCPVYIWQLDDGVQFYGFPAMGGTAGAVKVALHTLERTPTTPGSIDRTVHEAEIERVRAIVARYIPQLGGESLDARTCMYTLTPDEHFILDRHPAHPQIVIAAGFSGHGFKFCSVAGEIMADLSESRATRHDIDMFRIARAALR